MENNRSKQQILKEIKRLEDARAKDYKKVSAKYKKALENMDKAEDMEEKKHPERFKEIYKKYRSKGKKIMDQWYKASDAVSKKYASKLDKLYKEYGPFPSLNH